MANPDLEFYSRWMSYISDSAPFLSVITPGSHNSGAVSCGLRGKYDWLPWIPLNWLSCQKDGIAAQLVHGVRQFDIRLADTVRGIYCTHGLGRGTVSLEAALTDVRDFVTRFPSEFVEIDIGPGLAQFAPEGGPVTALICQVLNLPEIAFPHTFDLTAATMGDLRASGKHVMLRSSWADDAFNIIWPPSGTWSPDYNAGCVADGDRLYAYLREILAGPRTNIRMAMNRASGNSMWKQLPRDFMIADRPRFRALMEELMGSPDRVAKLNGLDFDFVTETHEQAGATILLNLTRGTVQEDRRQEFHDIINRTMLQP
jgi:hypothetical protein